MLNRSGAPPSDKLDEITRVLQTALKNITNEDIELFILYENEKAVNYVNDLLDTGPVKKQHTPRQRANSSPPRNKSRLTDREAKKFA